MFRNVKVLRALLAGGCYLWLTPTALGGGRLLLAPARCGRRSRSWRRDRSTDLNPSLEMAGAGLGSSVAASVWSKSTLSLSVFPAGPRWTCSFPRGNSQAFALVLFLCSRGIQGFPMRGFHGMDCAGFSGRGVGVGRSDRSGFHISEIDQIFGMWR
jgi:hypothetical protein